MTIVRLSIFFMGFFTICFQASPNFILNPSFESPTLCQSCQAMQMTSIPYWEGLFDLKVQDFISLITLNQGQYIDLQVQSSNGYMHQNVPLLQQGFYNLSLIYQAITEDYHLYSMQIWWNSNLQYTLQPSTTEVQFIQYDLYGFAGINNLTLVEVGQTLPQNTVGVCFDQLSLVWSLTNNSTYNESLTEINLQDDSPEQSQVLNKITLFFTITYLFPVNQIQITKYIAFVMDDLWLYFYDNRDYKGEMKDIFMTITTVQRLKFKVIQKALNINNFQSYIPISNYTQFSRKKIVQVEQTDQNFWKCLYPIFIYTLPQTMVMCILLRFLFTALKKYKISLFVRRYAFFQIAFLQIYLQGNLPFLFYMGFSQMTKSFTFAFLDRIFFSIAVLLLFCFTIFATIFYFMIGKLLQKRASYFIYCFYRCFEAYIFLTIKILICGLFRGAIHYFLFEKYQVQILCLILVESLVIVLSLTMQKLKKIFLTHTQMCLFVLYHSCFIYLDICLLLQKGCVESQQNLARNILIDIQALTIYLIILVSVSITIIDLIPRWLIKYKVGTQSEIDQQKIKIHVKKPSLITSSSLIQTQKIVEDHIQQNKQIIMQTAQQFVTSSPK